VKQQALLKYNAKEQFTQRFYYSLYSPNKLRDSFWYSLWYNFLLYIIFRIVFVVLMVKKEKLQELVFGIHPIIELLRAKRRSISTIYTTKPAPKIWDSIARLLPKHTQIQYVPRDVLTRLAGTTDHQGVVAWATPFQFRSKPFEPGRHPFIILLDGIQDPRNLGAIIRSAYCTKADGIIIGKRNNAPLTAAALKASAGLAEHSEIYQASSTSGAVGELKKAGYTIYLAALEGENALHVRYNTPLCLVIGNEAAGVSPEVLSSGTRITLPQRHSDISYNASVAAGILLFLIAHKSGKLT
jgi:23S rRNA (guanosine2251-2'-O)-methyltransferase